MLTTTPARPASTGPRLPPPGATSTSSTLSSKSAALSAFSTAARYGSSCSCPTVTRHDVTGHCHLPVRIAISKKEFRSKQDAQARPLLQAKRAGAVMRQADRGQRSEMVVADTSTSPSPVICSTANSGAPGQAQGVQRSKPSSASTRKQSQLHCATLQCAIQANVSQCCILLIRPSKLHRVWRCPEKPKEQRNYEQLQCML